MNDTTSQIIFRKGKKTILRPKEKGDGERAVRWLNHPKTTKFLNRRMPLSYFEEDEWIAADHKKHHSDISFAIDTLDGKHIGFIGLHSIDWINRRATTGTVIGAKQFIGKGYGTDAKMLLLDYAFNSLGLRKICSRVFAFNERSVRYSEKCGYVVEAQLKDHHFVDGEYCDEILMAVFREGWEPLWKEYKKS